MARKAKTPTDRLTRATGRRLRVKMLAARAALLQEQIWPRLWPTFIVVLVFVGAAFFNLFAMLPGWAHVLSLAAFCAALAAALHFAASHVRWPGRADVLARLESDSGLDNRPLQTLTDNLSLGANDAEAKALWATHLARQEKMLRAVRLRAPRANVPAIDPYAIRVGAVALVVLGFFYAGNDRWPRLGDSLSPQFGSAITAELVLDAWITPPEYVNSAPIFLPLQPSEEETATEVPASSVLSVRLSGVRRTPSLRRTLKDRTSAESWRVSLPLKELGDGAYTVEVPIEASANLEVFDGRKRLTGWTVSAVPDTAPTVRLKAPPSPSPRGQLRLEVVAADDYGIEAASVRLVLGPDALPRTGSSVMEPGKPVIEPLPLGKKKPKSIEDALLLDLTEHPWAGHEVTMTVTVEDEVGQKGISEPYTFVLPQRPFSDPVAQAIVEQRTALATDAYASIDTVALALDTMTLAAERFIPDLTLFLGLRVAYYRLTGPVDRSVVRSVYDLLWDLALRVEDGDLSLAERMVRDAQRDLADALTRNAPPEEIQQLTAALREAMNQLMAALAEAVQKALERGDYAAMPPGAQALTDQDFDRLLDSIEQLAQSGAHESAQDLLSQMQAMLDGLQLGGGPQTLTEEQAAMADGLEGLGDIVAEQRALMEETFRSSGRAADAQEDDRPPNELARDQAELRERLEELLGALAENGGPPNEELEKAVEAMGRAQDDLASGDRTGAVPDQNEALARMQRGMDQLSQQLSQSLGPGVSFGQNRNPGRSTDDGRIKVPEEGALQRARQILEDIKRRASDPTRDEEELEYLERLVPRF